MCDHSTSARGDKKYIYINNGAPILVVAHLDSRITKHFHFNVYRRDGLTICKTPTLDDRLGVYIALYALPKILGDGYADILLTDHEEISQSTAEFFAKDWAKGATPNGDPINKDINWIAEFDRARTSLSGGHDAVLYDFDDKATRDLLDEHGYKEFSRGSFTDICELEGLGVKAFNFGVGYHENHDTKAWACLEETEYAINMFAQFYKAMSATKLEHEKKVYSYSNHGKSWASGYQSQLPFTIKRFYIGELVSPHPGSANVYEIISEKDGKYTMAKHGESGLWKSTCAGWTRIRYTCAKCGALGATIPSVGDFSVRNLCTKCYTEVRGVLIQCTACGYSVGIDDLEDRASLLCSYCSIEVKRPIEEGEIVRFNTGCMYYVVQHAVGKDRFALWRPGSLITNGGNGYPASWLTPVRDNLELDIALETFDTSQPTLVNTSQPMLATEDNNVDIQDDAETEKSDDG